MNSTNGSTLETLGRSAQNTAKAQRDHSVSDPGQQNLGLVRMNPSSSMPPPTDQGVVVPTWYSFDLTHRRVQEGGWTHQVTARELPSSKEVAGVDMRITAGSFRELHWHLADEWAIMLRGDARVTVLSPDGAMYIDDVKEGDLWVFPAGTPHSIQGTGEDGCEFLLVFNQGSFSELTGPHTRNSARLEQRSVTAQRIKRDAHLLSPNGVALQQQAGDERIRKHRAARSRRGLSRHSQDRQGGF